MDRKIKKHFIYPGLGFPVDLTDVPMVKVRGEWIPDIDYTELEEKMALAVPLRPVRLTGNEVRFLRLHLTLTASVLARQLGVTHQAVTRWEQTGDEPTQMGWSTEKDLRLFVLARKGVGDRVFRQAYASFDHVRQGGRRRLGLPAGLISTELSQFLAGYLH